jgi:hypothetical protein
MVRVGNSREPTKGYFKHYPPHQGTDTLWWRQPQISDDIPGDRDLVSGSCAPTPSHWGTKPNEPYNYLWLPCGVGELRLLPNSTMNP